MTCEDKPTKKWDDDHEDLIHIDNIAGVRLGVAYGSCSIVGPEGSFVDPYPSDSSARTSDNTSNCHEEFAPLLHSWMANLQYFAYEYGGFGNVTRLYHAGIHPPGSVRETFHNEGRALDIKGIDWADGTWWRACAGNEETSTTTRYRRLVGVEASLRKYFGNVVARGLPRP